MPNTSAGISEVETSSENLDTSDKNFRGQTQRPIFKHVFFLLPILSSFSFLFHRITQNYKTVGDGRDLWGWSSPTPLPKQGHLQQAAQDLVQVGLEYPQRRRIHNLPGQPVPGLYHPQSKLVLPHVQMELPLLQFVPVAPCPVAGHH